MNKLLKNSQVTATDVNIWLLMLKNRNEYFKDFYPAVRGLTARGVLQKPLRFLRAFLKLVMILENFTIIQKSLNDLTNYREQHLFLRH